MTKKLLKGTDLELSKPELIKILEEHIPHFSREATLREQVDSIQIVSLVLALEEAFHLKCDLRVFGADKLQSVETLFEYLEEMDHNFSK